MPGVFAEIETNPCCKSQADGIFAARRSGIYRDRLPKIDMDAIRDRIAGGRSPTRIVRELGTSRGTCARRKARPQSMAWPIRVREQSVMIPPHRVAKHAVCSPCVLHDVIYSAAVRLGQNAVHFDQHNRRAFWRGTRDADPTPLAQRPAMTTSKSHSGRRLKRASPAGAARQARWRPKSGRPEATGSRPRQRAVRGRKGIRIRGYRRRSRIAHPAFRPRPEG